MKGETKMLVSGIIIGGLWTIVILIFGGAYDTERSHNKTVKCESVKQEGPTNEK